MMEKEIKDQRVTILMSDAEVKRVDRWAEENRIKSRGEAVRQLLNVSIDLIDPAWAVVHLFEQSKRGENVDEHLSRAMSIMLSVLKVHLESKWETITASRWGDTDEKPIAPRNELLERDVMIEMINELALPPRAAKELTPREEGLAELIVLGLTNAEIANSLSVSERLIDAQVAIALRGHGLNHRDELGDLAKIHLAFKHEKGGP